ncbi:MAG: O-antigen translocase [Anaerolineae bacterium]|nr:O-antigen translocase [Anaerolineae bacterium]
METQSPASAPAHEAAQRTEDSPPLAGQRKAYRGIFKATSLFGGVQVFNILISIVRSKIIALLLGPAGVGIAGLLTGTTTLVGGLTNFGLRTSAVKDVAAANASGDPERVATIAVVLRRWVWITGLLGVVITAGLSPWLSQLNFGNREFTLAIVWISVTLLFAQISAGQMVILQGLQKLQYLAQANVAAMVLVLLVSVPLYYFWRTDGIVPVIILSSLLSLALSWYFARKVQLQKVDVSWRTTLVEGKSMLRMGLMLSLGGLITTATTYVLNIFISNRGGVDQVGLYKAGAALITTYVGMIFAAMDTDYYPRLASVAHDNGLARNLINQQAEIAILILAPILNVFLVAINWIVILLYSRDFVAVNGMIHWSALGMYFKAVSWAIGYILLAKGASKLYFWNEVAANCYILGFNVAGYALAGLDGLGISFLAAYMLYLVQVYIVARRRYAFGFSGEFYRVFGIQLLLGVLCFAAVKVLAAPWVYGVGGLLILTSALYAFYELDRRLDLKSVIGSFLQNVTKAGSK